MRNRAIRPIALGLLLAAMPAIPFMRVTAEEKQAGEKQPELVAEGPFEGVPKAQVEAWKKKYAYQSLRGRLEYEKSAAGTSPKVGAQAAERIKEADRIGEVFEFANRRAISLAMLHGENVEKFVKSPGFGFSRMAPPGPSYLQEQPEEERIPPAAVTPLSEGDPSLGVTAPLVADSSADSTAKNTWKMPIADEVFGYHRTMADYFTRFDRFGLVKSVDQVAGFQPHAVMHAPPPPINAAVVAVDDRNEVRNADETKRWKIARLELVSLLKHETPRVYLSENLPRMDELSSVKTREASAFEAAALEKLVDGEDLDTASTPNRIEMLGALRATKQCTQCHQVPSGTLLGAFSYELRRDPPLKVPAPKVLPVQ